MMTATQRNICLLKWIVPALSVPIVMYGFSSGPPINRTGAPVDGGLNCTVCHRTFAPANSGTGRVSISTLSYTPGVKQTVTVTVEDPDAQRWGFQMTARFVSDETIQAGTFTPGNLRVRCDPDGHDAPCNGAKEFVEHVAAATQLGTRGHGTFTVEWTPPDKDFGEIVFYAAGNAANGDGTFNGDHIYTTSKVIRPACNLTEKPTITSVSDAASFRATIAANGMISIFGTGFAAGGNVYSAHASDLVNGLLPTGLDCVEVEVGGRKAPVFFVSGSQINAQAPLADVSGPMDLTVTAKSADQSAQSDPARVQVSAAMPSFFTVDGSHIAGVDVTSNNAALTGAAAAKPGDTVSLYGTGFGTTSTPLAPGEYPKAPTPLRDPVTVTVGGITLGSGDVLFVGAAPEAPGLCRIDLKLPATLADGDTPVTLRTGGQQTQAGTVIPVKR